MLHLKVIKYLTMPRYVNKLQRLSVKRLSSSSALNFKIKELDLLETLQVIAICL